MLGVFHKDSIKGMKIELVVTNIAIVVFYSYIWFRTIPSFTSFKKINIDTEPLYQKLSFLAIATFTVIVLVDIFFFKKISQLEEKKREVLDYREISFNSQDRLSMIDSEIKFYSRILSFICSILLWVSISLLVFILASPLHSILMSI